MTPIKSSIDLAMEKTEGLRLSDEERRVQRQKDAADLAAALILRWENEDLSQDDLLEELRSQEAAFPELRQLMLQQTIRRIGLQARSHVLLDVIRALLPDKARQMEGIIAAYRQAVESRKHALREQTRQELMQKGISGTAVEPNETGWQEWRSWAAQQEQAMQEELAALIE